MAASGRGAFVNGIGARWRCPGEAHQAEGGQGAADQGRGQGPAAAPHHRGRQGVRVANEKAFRFFSRKQEYYKNIC